MTSKSRFSSAFSFRFNVSNDPWFVSLQQGRHEVILTLGLVGALFYWYSKKIKSNGGGASSKW
jgi:hypothetical protein